MLTKWTKYSQVDGNSGSYTRPITVNVYFKSENPPPGYYDAVDRPKTQSFQTGHRHLFTSKCSRDTFKKKNEIPDMGAYEVDVPNNDMMPSAAFVGPTEKKKVKINLYDPHKELKKESGPGPGEYYKDKDEKDEKSFYTQHSVPSRETRRAKTTKGRRRETKIKSKFCLNRVPNTIGYSTNQESHTFSNAFQVTNNDRFGDAIEKKRPHDQKPAPGAYDAKIIPRRKTVAYSMGRVIKNKPKLKRFKAPGPAYYKPLIEPKSTSYHLNAQNLWMR